MLVDAGSSANTIGGPVGGSRNFISGNAEGVSITGSTATLVAGNLIGTDHRRHRRFAQLDRRNRHRGRVGHHDRRSDRTRSNVISGNKGDGIDVGGGATSTLVQGDYIGTDQTGTKPLANSRDGLSVDDASGVTIGGTSQGARNVISANTQAGVSISGIAATGVVLWAIASARITRPRCRWATGPSAWLPAGPQGSRSAERHPETATSSRPTPTAGIGALFRRNRRTHRREPDRHRCHRGEPDRQWQRQCIQIDGGSFNNTIGGTAAGAGNTIAFSSGIGVDVEPPPAPATRSVSTQFSPTRVWGSIWGATASP